MEKELHVKDIEFLTQKLPICEVSRFALINNQIKHDHFSQLQLRTYPIINTHVCYTNKLSTL